MNRGYKTIIEAGETAPWLAMVHGMAQDHRIFTSQIAFFKDSYRILLIDLPGHGLATDVPGPYGHMEMMAYLRTVLDQAAIGPTHYWGTHTGTAVGLLLAVREPERFKSLILEGPVISGHSMPYVTETLGRASSVARTEGVQAAIQQVFADAGWYDVVRARPEECRMEEQWDIISEFSGAPWTFEGQPMPANISDEELKALIVPTLIYNGVNDLGDFFNVSDRIKRNLVNVTHEIIPDAGGFPAWEFPFQVNDMVRKFLTKLS